MTKISSRRKNKLIKLGLSLVFVITFYLLNQQTPPPEVLGTIAPGYYKVSEFADGDTISVDMNGKSETIRLIGVDTPETHDPRKPVQCFGKRASEFTKNLIDNNPVRLESDEQSQNRDRYNRLLRYVYLPSGQLVQAEIIRAGYGFAYTSFPFTRSAEFKNLEQEAKNSNRGLWGSCQLFPNEYGGFVTNPE